METIVLMLISLLETFIIHSFFVYLLGKRYESKVIYYGVLLIFFLASATLSILAFRSMWIPLLFYSFCSVYSLFLFSGAVSRRLLAAGLIVAYGSITETLSIFFVSWFYGYGFASVITSEKTLLISLFSAKILLTIVVLCLTTLKRTDILHIPIRKLLPLFIAVLICTFFSIVNGLFALSKDCPVSTLELLSETGVFILSILFFHIYKSLVLLAEKELHNRLLEQQLVQESLHFERVDGYLKEVKSLKHDFTNHLTSMKVLMNNKNYIELDNYITRYLGSIREVLSEITTGVPSVDAIISFKKAEATNSEINFTVQTKDVTDIYVDPVHLNVVLSNILDNAIEACLKCSEAVAKKIELIMMIEKEHLYITVTNSSMPVFFDEGTLPKTAKEDKAHHGLGLESVERLMTSYGGMIHCEYINQHFIFRGRMKNIRRRKPVGNIYSSTIHSVLALLETETFPEEVCSQNEYL